DFHRRILCPTGRTAEYDQYQRHGAIADDPHDFPQNQCERSTPVPTKRRRYHAATESLVGGVTRRKGRSSWCYATVALPNRQPAPCAGRKRPWGQPLPVQSARATNHAQRPDKSKLKVKISGFVPVHLRDERSVQDLSRRQGSAEEHLVVLPAGRQDRR